MEKGTHLCDTIEGGICLSFGVSLIWRNVQNVYLPALQVSRVCLLQSHVSCVCLLETVHFSLFLIWKKENKMREGRHHNGEYTQTRLVVRKETSLPVTVV